MPSLLDSERFTLAEAGRRLGVHVSTLHRWRMQGISGRRLRCLKIGSRTFVTRDELEAFVAALSDPSHETAQTVSGTLDAAGAADSELAESGW